LLPDVRPRAWHTQNRRREAALEARLQRLEALHSAFSEETDRGVSSPTSTDCWQLPRRALVGQRQGHPSRVYPLRAARQPKQVRARASAQEGYKAYPESLGGKRCYSILKSIEAPSFGMAAMSADGPQKRSIEVTHANLPALYFRVCSFDLENRVQTSRDYNLLPNQREQESLMASRPVEAEWSVSLPATPDYEPHRTFVTRR